MNAAHYQERMERDLAEIRERVEAVGKSVDTATANAVTALLSRDRALASKTVLNDHPINRASREIDALCHRFTALHLPSAGVLRFVSAALRTSTALERVGDYAESIAKHAAQLAVAVPEFIRRDVELMTDQARSMLSQSLVAFQEQNEGLARGTMEMESTADGVYRRVYRDLVAEGEKSALEIRDLFGLHVVINRLERITDQAKNICEQTIFSVTGQTKQTKVFRILFADERNAGASLMAQAIAIKAFPESGRYKSAGWAPAESLDPAFIEFMDARGHDLRDTTPRPLDSSYEALRHDHVIVALSPGFCERVEEMPFGTIFLDWSEEAEEAGPRGEYEDGHREALYKFLAPRIRDLMETLRGENAG